METNNTKSIENQQGNSQKNSIMPISANEVINKITNSSLSPQDKISLLQFLKTNMKPPSQGENADLDQIQQKYFPSPMQYQSQNQSTPQQQYMDYSMVYPSQQASQQLFQPQQGMSQTQFEILKSKMDSISYEMIDLLRHVKEYTQRYMTAVREQDMKRIDEYINSVMQVDKTMNEMKQLQNMTEQRMAMEAQPPEEQAETKESIISRTTNGIKNFFGGLKDNVAGVTDLVKKTANIANNALSAKIIGGDDEDETPSNSNNTTNTSNTKAATPKKSNNKNIVSLDEYIKSNLNNPEGISSNTTSNTTATNTRSDINNFNKNNTTTPTTNQNTINQNTTPAPQQPNQTNQSMNKNTNSRPDKLNNAINRLNQNIQNMPKPENTVQTGGSRISTTRKNNKNNKKHKNNKNVLSRKRNSIRLNTSHTKKRK